LIDFHIYISQASKNSSDYQFFNFMACVAKLYIVIGNTWQKLKNVVKELMATATIFKLPLGD
jgi:hypothetical protein